MVQIDFSKIDHNKAYKYSNLMYGALVTDILFQFMEKGIHNISQNEILYILGVPEKDIDKADVVLYDLKTLAKQLKGRDKSEIYDLVDEVMNKSDFDKREFA